VVVLVMGVMLRVVAVPVADHAIRALVLRE
jgi:hypothetical protein